VGGDTCGKTLILAGGLGTRLGHLTFRTPKPMMPIRGEPFLAYPMRHLGSLGLRKFILAVAFMPQKIRDHFGDGRDFGWEIEYSTEPYLMGTGGAVLYAQPMWGDRVLVVNGDTYTVEDWRKLIDFHGTHDKLITKAVIGGVHAGAHVVEREAFAEFSSGRNFSMERDLFPLVPYAVYPCECGFADIGTPERLEAFREAVC